MVNFITSHIISKIDKNLKEIYEDNNYKGFIWFDTPIIEGEIVINRMNLQSPFKQEEIMPTSWYTIKPKTILEILNRLKKNEVYIKPKMGSYYIRIKPRKDRNKENVNR
jgi:hypothetical protein